MTVKSHMVERLEGRLNDLNAQWENLLREWNALEARKASLRAEIDRIRNALFALREIENA